MRRIVVLCLAAVLLGGCSRKEIKPRKEHFATDVMLRTTPVKNQGESSMCWAYAMAATIETRHIMLGDSVNLSVDWVARQYLRQQAASSFLSGEDRRISQRGMASMFIHLIETYGLSHYDAYHSDSICNYNLLCRKLDAKVRSAYSLRELYSDADKLLDTYIKPTPQSVFLYGAIYTPLEFAHSVCKDDEYQYFTSFTHHPYGQPFILEVPDNQFHDSFQNVPLPDFMRLIVDALRSGRPVCWEGDISEPGFSFERGYALLSDDDKTITAEMRQEQFEDHRTTDDHCMEICGLAHDQNGRRFFIMKNSWGIKNPYGGYMYVSYNYVMLKTIAVFIPQPITPLPKE